MYKYKKCKGIQESRNTTKWLRVEGEVKESFLIDEELIYV